MAQPLVSYTSSPRKTVKKVLDKSIDSRVKISIASIAELGVVDRMFVKSIGGRCVWVVGAVQGDRRQQLEERR